MMHYIKNAIKIAMYMMLLAGVAYIVYVIEGLDLPICAAIVAYALWARFAYFVWRTFTPACQTSG